MEFEARTSPVVMNHGSGTSLEGTGKPASSKGAPVIGEKLAAELEVFDRVAAEVRKRLDPSLPMEARRKLVIEMSSEMFGVAPTWVAFFREVFARGGVIPSLFTDPAEKKAYEQSEEHGEVLEMLTTLRSRDLPENDPSESQRMITVRIPKCVHDYICDEANALEVSVNKLCISRLLQRSDERMIPTSQQKRRGRKPGAPSTSVAAKTQIAPVGPNPVPNSSTF